MTKQNQKFVLALVAGILSVLSVACGNHGGTGMGPDPTTCQDPKATNNGGSLPCVYAAPATSFVNVTSFSPPDKGTIRLSSTTVNGFTEIGLSVGVSQADQNAATAAGDIRIVIKACLVDSPTNVDFGALGCSQAFLPTNTSYGTVAVRPGLWETSTLTKVKFLAIQMTRSGGDGVVTQARILFVGYPDYELSVTK